MMETEIWPNLLRACRRGRGEDRAGQRPDFGAVVSALPAGAARSSAACSTDVDRFCMQSEESARRIIEIGADRERVSVTGSLKFDSLEIPGAVGADRGRNRVLRYFRITPERPVVIAASTLQGRRGAGARGVPAHPRAPGATRC